MSIELNATTFKEKLEKFCQVADSETAYVFTLGTVQDDVVLQPKTSLFHLWLLQYEFSETAFAIYKQKAYFLTSKRKQVLLTKMNLAS